MNARPASRLCGHGTYFEIQQTADQVVIVMRDRLTDAVCRVVTFRGSAESQTRAPRQPWAREIRPPLAENRW